MLCVLIIMCYTQEPRVGQDPVKDDKSGLDKWKLLGLKMKLPLVDEMW